jgi:hypothetical protein
MKEQIEIDFHPEITVEYLINKLWREIANLRISKMNFDFYKKVQENEFLYNHPESQPSLNE